VPAFKQNLAYPTDAKELEKAKRKREKEAGIVRVVKKKFKVVEDHHDDCGTDLSSLHDVPSHSVFDFPPDDYFIDSDFEQCLQRSYQQRLLSAYPTIETVAEPQPEDANYTPGVRDYRACLPRDSTCPGCKFSRAKDDWTRTREFGQCGWPYTKAFVPKCVACQLRTQISDPRHTLTQGECRHAGGGVQMRTRRRHRPAEVREPAHHEPTSHIPANVRGEEAGRASEDALAESDVNKDPESNSNSSGSGSADAGIKKQGRGPDKEEGRQRKTCRDQGDNPNNAADWTNFDIGGVVRLLRTDREAAIRVTLRKLHVRWWHASAQTMINFLKRVGVPDRVIAIIPEICDTCKICREWQKPGPANVASVSLPDKFNEQVECDLLFVRKKISSFTCCADAQDCTIH